ncbi:MAG: YqeG family HAD IIIA-type phosphatase [bacterium]
MSYKLLKVFGFAEKVHLIDIEKLLMYNIKGIIFDIDNTLVPWGSWEIPKEIEAFIEKMKERDLRACLLSNSDKRERALFISRRLELPVIFMALKPFPIGFNRALKVLNLDKKDVISIGDQLFMDVLGSNIVGIRPILVKPLTNRDFLTTRLLRIIERRFLPKIVKEAENFGYTNS